jgi:IclR family transcriptional regulator, KDG regulon repressor
VVLNRKIALPNRDGTAQAPSPSRYTIEAVANALSILDAIADREVLGLAEAADIAGVSKSTAYRLLTTMEGASLVERLPAGGYRAGVGAVRWATNLLAQLDVRTAALPILRWLRDETGETVNLALLREASLVYVEVVESTEAFRMAELPGSVAPIHATALGKAVAIRLEPTRLAALLGPEPYQRLNERTHTTWQELARDLEGVRLRGYSLDLEETELGVVCVAAPIVVADEVAGAISISAPRARLDDGRIKQVGVLLVEATQRIAVRLAPSATVRPGSTKPTSRPGKAGVA